MLIDIGFYLLFIILYYMVVIFGFWVADKLNYPLLRIAMATTMILITVFPIVIVLFFGYMIPDLSSMILIPPAV